MHSSRPCRDSVQWMVFGYIFLSEPAMISSATIQFMLKT